MQTTYSRQRIQTWVFRLVLVLTTLVPIVAVFVQRQSDLGSTTYPYLRSVPLEALWIFLAVTVALSLTLWSLYQLRQHPALALTLLLSVAFVAYLLIHLLQPNALSSLVRSDWVNGYYTPSTQHSPRELLRNYDSITTDGTIHIAGNMPGKILLFDALGVITESPELMGALIIIISNLGALLVFGITRRLFGSTWLGLLAALLYLIIPSRLYFVPLLNVISPLGMLAAFYLYLRYWQNRKVYLLLALGALLYLAFFFDPLPFALGLLFVGLFLTRYTRGTFWKSVGLQTLLVTIGFGLVYLVMRFGFSFDIARTFVRTLEFAKHFNIDVGRPYLGWVVHNLKDFVLGIGSPLAVLLVLVVGAAAQKLRAFKQPQVWFPLTLTLTVLLLDLAGLNRGETTRLWIFMMALVPVAVAWLLAKRPRLDWYLVLALTLLQITISISAVGWVVVPEKF